MVNLSVIFRNVIVYVAISSRLFMFSQSRVKVLSSLYNVEAMLCKTDESGTDFLSTFFTLISIFEVSKTG